jgi:8-oxo-dGTP pyrophosphatase MutT (NUDIX family)
LPLSSFHAFRRHLHTRLQQPLPGHTAQFAMAPTYRQNPALASVVGKACREAGVLIPIFPRQDAPTLLLTVRHGDLKHHSGQVSFPGGAREPDEPLHVTALREAWEEIGIVPEAVELLGALTPLYIPPSNFCVYPFVGLLSEPPVAPLQTAEVAAVLHVPVAHLLAPATRGQEDRLLRGQRVTVPFFAVQDYKVWGATAMMLAELLALLEA